MDDDDDDTIISSEIQFRLHALNRRLSFYRIISDVNQSHK